MADRTPSDFRGAEPFFFLPRWLVHYVLGNGQVFDVHDWDGAHYKRNGVGTLLEWMVMGIGTTNALCFAKVDSRFWGHLGMLRWRLKLLSDGFHPRWRPLGVRWLPVPPPPPLPPPLPIPPPPPLPPPLLTIPPPPPQQ